MSKATLLALRGVVTCAILGAAGPLYWTIHRAGPPSTQYEMIGSIVIVTALALLAAVPVCLAWLALLKWSGGSATRAVFESAIGAVIYAGALCFGVARLVPFENWDRHGAVFGLLIGCAAIVSVLGGIAARHICLDGR